MADIDRTITAQPVGDDADQDATLRPRTFESYVGQQRIKEKARGARRSTTSCCAARRASARRRSRTSSRPSWA